jgi:hypothetical protein
MAPESKMDAEICIRHTNRISSFSKRFFAFFFFCFYDIFIEINLYQKLNIVAGIQDGGLRVIYLLKNIIYQNYHYQLC